MKRKLKVQCFFSERIRNSWVLILFKQPNIFKIGRFLARYKSSESYSFMSYKSWRVITELPGEGDLAAVLIVSVSTPAQSDVLETNWI